MLLSFWIFNTWPLYSLTVEATCFFYLGAFLGYRQSDFKWIDRYGIVLTSIYLGISLLDVFTREWNMNYLVHKFGMLFGICTAFYITSHLLSFNRIRSTLNQLALASFFVFAAHQPLLTITKKILYKLFQPSTDIEIILLYFSIPTFVTLICLGSYQLIISIAPKFTKIITGRQ